jgi:hypothetical protein
LLRRLRQHVIPLVFQLPSSKLVCNAEDIHPESFIPCNTLQSTLDQHGRGFGCLRVDGLTIYQSTNYVMIFIKRTKQYKALMIHHCYNKWICVNPMTSLEMIQQLFYKNREASHTINVNGMTPWHMFLIRKGIIS